jgi:hypothetical protein
MERMEPTRAQLATLVARAQQARLRAVLLVEAGLRGHDSRLAREREYLRAAARERAGKACQNRYGPK